MRYLYCLIFYMLLPIVVLRLLWRAIKAPAYIARWSERFGFGFGFGFGLAKVEPPRIWLHSVSVGETLAAAPLARQLLQRYPDHTLLITTTTPTGSERVQALFSDELNRDDGRVEHCYAPYDLPDCLYRFLNRAQPDLLVIMETELWPNTIAACAKREIPVVVANARLSEKSAKGYRKFSALTDPMLQAISCVAAQNKADGDRFLQLGLPVQQLSVTGNIKFDLELPAALCEQAVSLKTQWSDKGARSIWLVASTHQGEDEQILAAFTEVLKTQPNTLLVLVPRHPERFNNIVELCQNGGFNTERRSAVASPKRETQVFVGDTMGELLLFFGASDIAFVGGSLVPVGGHNLIEPAAWSLPILSGPALHNFTEVSALLSEQKALTITANSIELARAVTSLLQNQEQRNAMGQAAKKVAEDNRGALERLLVAIDAVGIKR